MLSGKATGFTLIELLIVVAIIAILAAIAVPNFLEAQTRSKVARVKTDMRSLNTAFMAYYNDYMRVPPDGDDENALRPGLTWYLENPGQQPDYKFVDDTRDPGFVCLSYFVPLTTPVAYITSVPHDGFTRRMPFAYGTRGWPGARVTYAVVSSCGPDQIEGDWLRWNHTEFASPQYPEGLGLPYDSTNGTKSRGDIWRGVVVQDPVSFNAEFPFNVQ